MKKRVLICLYAYYPFNNANTNVIMPLIKRIAQKYEVHITTRNVGGSAPAYEIIDDIHIHRYAYKNSGFSYNVRGIAEIDRKKPRVWYKQVPVYIITWFFRLLCRLRCFWDEEEKSIAKLLEENEYAFVMTTCCDFYSCVNMLKIKKRTKFHTPWIVYFMDPHSMYISFKSESSETLDTETEIYKHCDLALVTREIFAENQTNAFSPFLDKTRPFRFGNFVPLDMPLKQNIFIKEKINCVYAGSLGDEGIRSPRYLFQLIDELDDRFVFHIIAYFLAPGIKELFDKTVENKHRVVWHRTMPFEDCMGIICHADCLINLANKSINQTPSKVFDYIASGRPIINLYSLEKDTSKYYLENYPLKLNVYEDTTNVAATARMVSTFLVNNSGHRISQDVINERYKEYRSDVVTEETFLLMEAFLGL